MKASDWLLVACVSGITVAPAWAQVTIDEVRVDQPGTDNDEYFELAGPPGQSLTGMTYLVIGDSTTDSCGVIESVVNLSGKTMPVDGHFLCAKSSFTLAPGVDFTTSAINFENVDNVTHLLVAEFTGANGQDLDTNNDGVLDVMPWAQIIDSLSLVVGAPVSSDCTYSTTPIGPDPSNPGNGPWHAFRCPDATGAWVIGPFNPTGGRDTPGTANPGAPAITSQPAGGTACMGTSFTTTVGATGASTLAFQWRHDGVNVAGATASSLTIDPVRSQDAGDYDVIVSASGCGSVTSDVATLVVAMPPVISTQPRDVSAFSGEFATLEVAVTGGAVAYQWRKDGLDLASETGTTLVVGPLSAPNAGDYDVVVTNGCGSTTSRAAHVDVSPIPMVTIDEVRVRGGDGAYVELAGDPDQRLDGLTFVVVAEHGDVRAVIDLSGRAIPADGHFLVVDGAVSPCGAPSNANGTGLGASENESITHFLVARFTGSVGDDLDVDDDCALDSHPWFAILDEVSLVAENGRCAYAAAVGPDGSASPRHALRCPDRIGSWLVDASSATCAVAETPGSGNPPCILQDPLSVRACEGSSVAFTVAASGTPPVRYQWKRDGSPIVGAIDSTLTIATVRPEDAGGYSACVTDAFGSTESAVATLDVDGSIRIEAQPQSRTALVGSAVSLTVSATGNNSPLAYQWRKDGIEIAGASSDTIAFVAVTITDAGAYDVVVSSACGSVTSDRASLTVLPQPLIVINEIRVAASASDPDRYFELVGHPGRALDGLTYLVVGGAAFDRGIVEGAIDLAGQMMPANGHFLAAASGSSLACAAAADLVLSPHSMPLAGDHDVTHLVVFGFTGSVGDDLDFDDDCILDRAPWLTLADRVSLDLGGDGACFDAPLASGPGRRHVYRCPDGAGDWQADATTATCDGVETPGRANPPCVLSGPRDQTICEGQPVAFSVVAAGVGSLSFAWKKDGVAIPEANGDTLTIGYALPRDAGAYSVDVSDVDATVSSETAALVVEPFFSIRAGNVNAASDSVTDVLFVNGSPGAECDRVLTIDVNQPFDVRIVNPPSMAPGEAHFALYVWSGEPTKSNREILPGGIGWMAMPTPMSGRSPQPDRRANNLGAPFGSENWPMRFRPTRAAPTVLFQSRRGFRTPVSYTLQGIIQDTASPNGQLAVTNGLVLVVR
ncbi:MAG: immunoglobulin domain-containing protein [Planctomycetes bacterium]|nr:immunoglobulin domain-containing protein [Planctomycetota bacterium]